MNNENKDIIFPQINISLSFDKKVKKSELFQITNANDAYTVFQSVFSKDTFDWKEEMIMLCLSRGNKVLGYYKVSSGGIAGTICDPKIIFTVALNCSASYIIIAHNHPSGRIEPSAADRSLTKSLKEAAKLLGMGLVDHIIMGEDAFYSFADDGAL